jgi:hypothetical protein
VSVAAPRDELPPVVTEADLRLGALESLAAEQRKGGLPAYVSPEERDEAFLPALLTPSPPTLRTAQYASPSGTGGQPHVASSTSASPQVGGVNLHEASRLERPRPKPNMGTFSNIMVPKPEPSRSLQTPSEPSPARSSPKRERPNSRVSQDEDNLADILFGGNSAPAGARTSEAHPTNVATSSPAAPLMDLLGDFNEPSIPTDQNNTLQSDFEDLFGDRHEGSPHPAHNGNDPFYGLVSDNVQVNGALCDVDLLSNAVSSAGMPSGSSLTDVAAGQGWQPLMESHPGPSIPGTAIGQACSSAVTHMHHFQGDTVQAMPSRGGEGGSRLQPKAPAKKDVFADLLDL